MRRSVSINALLVDGYTPSRTVTEIPYI